MPADPPLQLYDADEMAVFLRCTVSWLKEQARLRRIPFTMIGGSYRWTDEHLREIVRLGERAPVSVSSRQVSRRPGATAPSPGVLALKARPPRRAGGLDTTAGPELPGPAQAVAAEPSTRD